MIDWKLYQRQLLSGVSDLSKLSPEAVRGYGATGSAGQKTNRLDGKTRELISIAVAITLRCDGRIAVHTDAARKWAPRVRKSLRRQASLSP
jgi:alkylhydroperoxidase/carboxymuconolactone decarboxylase family protein YurZ